MMMPVNSLKIVVLNAGFPFLLVLPALATLGMTVKMKINVFLKAETLLYRYLCTRLVLCQCSFWIVNFVLMTSFLFQFWRFSTAFFNH